MAKANNKKEIPAEVAAIIQEEIEPVKDSLEVLSESAKELKDNNTNLLKENADLLKEKTDLIKEKTALLEENSNLQENILKLSKRNARLIQETKLVLTKSHASVQAAKKKLDESKKLFVESASVALEEHINEITRSAFNAAKTVFEKDFNIIENDLMKEVGALFSPYMSDKSLPSKLSKLESKLEESNIALEAIKAASLKAVQKETIAKKKLENQLKETLSELRDIKLNQFKESLINKLPSGLHESAREKLAKVGTISEIKRIYLSVVKESSSEQTEKPNPVEDKQKTVVTEAKRPDNDSKGKAKVAVTLNKRSNMLDDDDSIINDPEMLARAGIKF